MECWNDGIMIQRELFLTFLPIFQYSNRYLCLSEFDIY
jgi:hypothetical protein